MPWFRNKGSHVLLRDDQMPEWGGEWVLEGAGSSPAGNEPEVVVSDVEVVDEHVPAQVEAQGRPSPRATVAVWEDYAASLNLEVPEGATKAEIRALVDATERG